MTYSVSARELCLPSLQILIDCGTLILENCLIQRMMVILTPHIYCLHADIILYVHCQIHSITVTAGLAFNLIDPNCSKIIYLNMLIHKHIVHLTVNLLCSQ